MEKTLKHIAPESRRMLEEAKQAILSVEPEAEVYLFGSRARGDFTEDSDWDLLVLLPGEVTQARKSNLIEKFFPFQLKRLVFFDLIIISKDDISNKSMFSITPFYNEVTKEQIAV